MILKDGTDPMYRICGQFQETIHHIVAGCTVIMSWPILNTYTHTTKLPCSYLHWNICKAMNIDTNEKWYEHEPQTVTRQHHNLVANANTNRYWDKGQRPDIVIKNKHETSCVFIDISISTEKNTSVKVTERLSKYKDLEIKVERMWGVKATTILVVIKGSWY